MFINDKINISKHGALKIKEALYYKGIDKEIIDEKIKRISTEEEKDRAFVLGQKKLLSIREEDTRKKGVKLSNYLIGRGFEYEIVRNTVKKLLDTEFDDFE
jgi:regulatory protein